MYTLCSAWSFWKIDSSAKTAVMTPIRKIHLNGFLSLKAVTTLHHRLRMFFRE